MTVVVIALASPFLFLFWRLSQLKFAGDPPETPELYVKMEENIQDVNTAISASGQPAVADSVIIEKLCLWSKLGEYSTIGPHYNLGVPGLLLTLSLLGLTLYCVWYPVVIRPE